MPPPSRCNNYPAVGVRRREAGQTLPALVLIPIISIETADPNATLGGPTGLPGGATRVELTK